MSELLIKEIFFHNINKILLTLFNMKIFDCTTYFDEKMLMDVRFNVLDEYVHKFIVVESIYSHSGEKKI